MKTHRPRFHSTRLHISDRLKSPRVWLALGVATLCAIMLGTAADASFPSSDAGSTTKHPAPAHARVTTCTINLVHAGDFPTAPFPYSVATADLNGDPFLDLAVANRESDNVSVLVNDGTGNFLITGDFAVGSQPESVALADLNHDNHLDLVTANAGSSDVSVLLGNGDGTFQGATNFSAGPGPESVAIADLNGDGDPDLAVSNVTNQGSVLMGNGDGTFQSPTTIFAGSNPSSVVVGDFNGDSFPDLAITNRNSDDVSIVLNDGSGGFGSATNFAAGDSPMSMAVADIDNNGTLDLVIGDYNSAQALILWGYGDGTFAQGLSLPVGSEPTSVALADFDNDGFPDIADTDSGLGGEVHIWHNDGTGGFDNAYGFSFTAGRLSMTVGDFNNDSLADVATTDYDNNQVNILLNQCVPQGTPTPTGTPSACFPSATDFSTGGGPQAVAVGDFNQDNKVDLVVAKPNSDKIAVLLGNGAGSFGAPLDTSVGFLPVAVAVGDLNGDGRLDAVTANNNSNSATVLLGNGGGGFGPPDNQATGIGPTSVALGDFERDGDLDIAVANYSNSTIRILRNDGTGHFPASTNLAVGGEPYAIAVADLNGDGYPDLVWAEPLSNDFAVALNNGSGNFGPGSVFTVSSNPLSLAIADFNGDGHLDVATANGSSSDVTVRLGNGAGGFGPAANFPAGAGPASVAAGDFNGDGHLDLAIPNNDFSVNDVTVLLGDGSGNFSQGSVSPVGQSPASVAVGDFDRNFSQDLVVANSSGGGVSVLLNRCPPAPTLTPTNTLTPTVTGTPTNTSTVLPTSTVISPWSIVAPYPIPVYGNTVVGLGASAFRGDSNVFYSFGGYSNGHAVSSVYYYVPPPQGNNWVHVTDMPQPLYNARAVLWADRIYILGGLDSNNVPVRTFYMYNTMTGYWTTFPQMPDVRQSANVFYLPQPGVGGSPAHDKIYVMGGFNGLGTEMNQTWEYDFLSATWSTKAPIPVPMAGSAVAYWVGSGQGRYIYLMGSRGSDPNRPATALHYRYNIDLNTWQAMSPLPVQALGASAAGAYPPHTLVIWGGAMNSNPPTYYKTTYLYDTVNDTWARGPDMNEEHGFAGGSSGTGLTNRLLIVGGRKGPNGDLSTTVETTLIDIGPTATPTATPSGGGGTPISLVYPHNTAEAIPSGGTLTSTLIVTATLGPERIDATTDLQVVGLNFDYPNASDLRATLISPDGTRVPLFTHVCGATAWTPYNTDFGMADSAPYSLSDPSVCPPMFGTFRPEGSLASLLGGSRAGTWTLQIVNDSTGRSGTLEGWGLMFTDCSSCQAATPTPTSTPAPPVLVGHVTWQGPPAQPSVRQQLPITLTLCLSGTPASYSATTDSSGFFTVTLPVSTGSYNWQAKGAKYLATSGTVLLTAGSTTQVEMGTQRAGDVDLAHNNVVNIADFNTFKGVSGTTSSIGDLNNDGVSNVADFNLIKANFSTNGASLSCP